MAGVCEGKCMGCSPGDEPPDPDEMPQLYEALQLKAVTPYVA